MEYKPLAQLQGLADVRPVEGSVMAREQRLQRWIQLLERNPKRRLRSLHEIEHLSPAQLQECRTDESPLTVAYDDPILRAAGLKSDRVGDCMAFFELNDRQMHHAFCSCHVGIRLSAMQAAQRLRHVLRIEGFRGRVRAVLSHVVQALFPKLST